MADKIRVKISIADRVYPLNISPSEEDDLRKVAHNVETLIKEFEKNYAVKDKQDVLAMCALQFASQLEKANKASDDESSLVSEKLNALNTLINQVI
ncbi:MAG: cell division protein ZapA [Flavobacteriales bacterium]|nr:cell division protein ZapA [Flavobacteriales bacterium]